MAVRYDKNFLAEIKKVVSAYNRKINRLSKTEGNYILPEKFGTEAMRTLKATASSRTEVRRRLKDLESFTAKGGEKLIKVGKATIPKYTYANIKRYKRLLSYQTTKKLKKYESTHPVSNAKVQPFTFSQYGSAEYLTLKAKKMNLLEKDLSNLTKSEVDKYLDKLIANTKEKDLTVWQNNYIAILEDTGLSYGYDTDKLEAIVNRLGRLSPADFDDLSFKNRNIRQITNSYKILPDITSAKDLADISDDVINNLDSIYENLDDILKEYE